MSVRFRLVDGSLLVSTALVALACGGGQSEAPPAEAPPAPPPAAAAPPPAATAPAAAPAAPEAAPSAAPQAAAPAAPPQAEQHGPHHGRGMAALFGESIAKIELKPDQKAAVDAAVSELGKQGEQHAEAGKQLASDIADGVAAGKIDHKKTDADVKKLVADVDSSKAGTQDAIDKIHKALDPEQRKKLVEEMRAKGEEMREKGEREAGDEKEHDEHLKMLSDQLGLTPEQTDKLKAKLKDVMKTQMATMKTKMGAMHKHMKAIGDAFETDKFDAKKAGVGEHAGEMAQTMAKNRIQFVEAVLGVITPEQRAKFAEHIRSHAEGG